MRFFRQHFLRCLSLLCSLGVAAVLTACASDSQSKQPLPPPQDVNQLPLRVGDKVKIDLLGLVDWPPEGREQDVLDDGTIVLPLLGHILAVGKTPTKLDQEITTNYVPRYFTHMNVTITPVARFFFVGGQVNNNAGGRIVWAGPITIMGAIQAAGDFTPYAKRSDVQITRGDQIIHVNCIKALKNPKLDIWIYPGDRIFVQRRF
jgi:polysaccharide biosynthesis/export protein VpsN